MNHDMAVLYTILVLMGLFPILCLFMHWKFCQDLGRTDAYYKKQGPEAYNAWIEALRNR
jgi:hypothetical protein